MEAVGARDFFTNKSSPSERSSRWTPAERPNARETLAAEAALVVRAARLIKREY